MVERGFVEQVEEASIINELEMVCSTSKESNTQEVFYSIAYALRKKNWQKFTLDLTISSDVVF